MLTCLTGPTLLHQPYTSLDVRISILLSFCDFLSLGSEASSQGIRVSFLQVLIEAARERLFPNTFFGLCVSIELSSLLHRRRQLGQGVSVDRVERQGPDLNTTFPRLTVNLQYRHP
jgi:hypothetical protein